MGDEMIHAFDPGITTGYCHLSSEGEVLDKCNLSRREVYKLLEELQQKEAVLTYVVEDYKIFPGKEMMHSMQKLSTAQIIGSLEYSAYLGGHKFITQMPADKLIGYKWMGATPPTNHAVSHYLDAMAHGIYYLVKHNYIKPPVLKKLSKTP